MLILYISPLQNARPLTRVSLVSQRAIMVFNRRICRDTIAGVAKVCVREWDVTCAWMVGIMEAKVTSMERIPALRRCSGEAPDGRKVILPIPKQYWTVEGLINRGTASACSPGGGDETFSWPGASPAIRVAPRPR